MTNRTAMSRILMVRPSALGDVCRTVPVLASLRGSFPQAEIDWIVRDAFLDAVAAHPSLTRAIPFPRASFARAWREPAAARWMIRWFRDLGRRGYDLVLDCQGLGRSGLMTWSTRAPRRVGFSDAPEFAWLGYTHRHRIPRTLHTVDRMLALLEAEGLKVRHDLRLYTPEADRAWWVKRRQAIGIGGEPYAVLSPTASRASKRWPPIRWRELIGPLQQRGFPRLVIIGGPGEDDQVRGLVDSSAAEAKSLCNLVGELSVGQMMAVLAEADLVIANDSAPLHIAVGFDRPCVGLFGPTDPALVGPYRRPEAVVRRYRPDPGQSVSYRDHNLDDSLMRLIGVDHVLERVDAVLAGDTDPAMSNEACGRFDRRTGQAAC